MSAIIAMKDAVRLFIGDAGTSLTAANKVGSLTTVGDIGGEAELIDVTTIESMAREFVTGLVDSGTMEVTQNLTGTEYNTMTAYRDNGTELIWGLSIWGKKNGQPVQVLGLTARGVISNVTLSGISTGSILTVNTSVKINGLILKTFVDPIGAVFGNLITGITVSTVGGVEATVEVGDTLQLVTAIEPFDASNPGVTWTASDGGATVSAAGLVTGVAEGDVTITATAQDGSGVTGSLSVTVTDANV